MIRSARRICSAFRARLTADKTVRKVTIPLSHGEAAVLEAALRTAVTRILGW